MNTTAKGTEFENKVFDYFSSLLDSDDVANAPKKHSKIFKHKIYTATNGRTIDFDITIETYNPHSKDEGWSSLVVIECKNYTGHKVDISDMDEFEHKISLISTSGIKGIMVTTSGFSDTEIDQARKSHLALVVFSDDSKNWIVSRNQNYLPEKQMTILKKGTDNGILPVVYNEGNFTNLPDLLVSSGLQLSNTRIVDVPYLSNENIKEISSNLYKNYIIQSKDIAGELIAKAYPSFRITTCDMPEGQLGTLSIRDQTITLSNAIITDSHRLHFTLAHELGHIVLHGSILTRMSDNFAEYDERFCLANNIVKRLECQANLFASYILMPQNLLLNHVSVLFHKYGITTGRLWLDNQPCNIRDVNIILKSLSDFFDVSKTTIKLRLIQEGLLYEDCKDSPQRLGRMLLR